MLGEKIIVLNWVDGEQTVLLHLDAEKNRGLVDIRLENVVTALQAVTKFYEDSTGKRNPFKAELVDAENYINDINI